MDVRQRKGVSIHHNRQRSLEVATFTMSVRVSPCFWSHGAHGAELGLCGCSSAQRNGLAELPSLTSLRGSKRGTPTLSLPTDTPLSVCLVFQRPPENRGDFGWAPEEDPEQRPVHASTDESVADLDGMTSLARQGGDTTGRARGGGGRGGTEGRRGAAFAEAPPLPRDCDHRRRTFLGLIS